MRLASFHHLTTYKCFPGASDDKYLILPFRATKFTKEKTPYYINCQKNITFLVLSVLTEENEPDKSRLIKFPYEFSFIISPLQPPQNNFFEVNSKYNYVGPVVFVPGKRNTIIFIAVLGVKSNAKTVLERIDICLFIINKPDADLTFLKNKHFAFVASPSESEYLTKIIEIEKNPMFEKIAIYTKPTKKYIYNSNNKVKNIIFMSDGRHFLVINDQEVFLYHIEIENQYESKIKLPNRVKILNCDYRNDTLLILAEINDKTNHQEIMFFNLQDRQTFFAKDNDGPSFRLYVKTSITKQIRCPGISIVENDKGSENLTENNKNKEFKYLHNTVHVDDGFIVCGCKFLPGDNRIISTILYEVGSKNLFVYFFKLNHPPLNEDISVYDIYQLNSIRLIQEDEIYPDIQKYFRCDQSKNWFDIIGDDNEFEFTFMFYWQIIVRFHYVLDDNPTKSEQKKYSSVQFINVKNHTEDNCQVIVPDQQSEAESAYKYLPHFFKTKKAQIEVFQNTRISIEWLKILGPKPIKKPYIFHIDSIESNQENELKEHTGFRTFATCDLSHENQDK